MIKALFFLSFLYIVLTEKCTYIPNCNMTCPRDTVGESVVMASVAIPVKF